MENAKGITCTADAKMHTKKKPDADACGKVGHNEKVC